MVPLSRSLMRVDPLASLTIAHGASSPLAISVGRPVGWTSAGVGAADVGTSDGGTVEVGTSGGCCGVQDVMTRVRASSGMAARRRMLQSLNSRPPTTPAIGNDTTTA